MANEPEGGLAVIFICIGGAVFSFLMAIGEINGLYLGKRKDEIKKLDENFNNLIQDKTKLRGFNSRSASVNFDKANGSYYLDVFGLHERTENSASLVNFSNVRFEISEENAEALLSAVQNNAELAKFVKIKDSNFGNIANTEIVMDEKDNLNLILKLAFNRKNVKTSYKLIQEVYNALENAVVNAYNQEVKTVGEAGKMETAIKDKYYNSSIFVAGISDVYIDEELNRTHFYIDTIHADGEKYEHHKAIVKINDAQLTPEEAYGRFLKGEISSFEDLSKAQEQEDTIIFDD